MKIFTSILVAITLVMVIQVLADIANREQKTFTVADKYSQLECVNVFCLSKQISYYIVTTEKKTYTTIDEAVYDKFKISGNFTATISPMRGYIIGVGDRDPISAENVEKNIQTLIPPMQLKLGKYTVMLPGWPWLIALIIPVIGLIVRRAI